MMDLTEFMAGPLVGSLDESQLAVNLAAVCHPRFSIPARFGEAEQSLPCPTGYRVHRPQDHGRSSTDSTERNAMDPQKITEEPQDRTGSWVRRPDDYKLQDQAEGRS